MSKEEKTNLFKNDDWTLFRWGLIGLTCILFGIYIFFIAVSPIYEEDTYNIWADLGPLFLKCLPCMIGAILGFFVGYAFRGKERKDISLVIDDKSDAEKRILIGILATSMEEKPEWWKKEGK